MKTVTTLQSLFTTLSNNTSTANNTLALQLIGDQHRYLLQKYFDNEKTVTTTTVGSSNLTTTASLASGATSATLTAAWTNPTGQSPTNFSNGDQRVVTYTKNSTAISWTDGLSSTATTAITSLGFQYYNVPANISKITNDTINIGQQKFTPRFLQTRQEWDLINFLPYNSNIPAFCFLYNGQLGIFPIPSSSGNILTFNYKSRVPDLSFADYTTPGTVTMTAGSTTVTGSGTTWATTLGVPTGVDISFQNLYLRAEPPKGDGIWYPINQIASDTSLTLGLPVINSAAAGTSATLGQMPLLAEDFHDMLVFGALMVYFSSIRKDEMQFKQFEAMYNQRLDLLEDYAGTKNANVNLGDVPIQSNPNLYIFSNS